MGQEATEEIVHRYTERFESVPWHAPVWEEVSSSKKGSQRIVRAIQGSIASSTLAWIFLGRNTGGGNQLEVVKNLGPFLGLPIDPNAGDSRYISIQSPLGEKEYRVTFTKGMWRFMYLQQGFLERLRPDPKLPSPYVIVFVRSEGDGKITMSVYDQTTEEVTRITERSRSSGFVGVSSTGSGGRAYRWY